jgi:hypothetical protein
LTRGGCQSLPVPEPHQQTLTRRAEKRRTRLGQPCSKLQAPRLHQPSVLLLERGVVRFDLLRRAVPTKQRLLRTSAYGQNRPQRCTSTGPGTGAEPSDVRARHATSGASFCQSLLLPPAAMRCIKWQPDDLRTVTRAMKRREQKPSPCFSQSALTFDRDERCFWLMHGSGLTQFCPLRPSSPLLFLKLPNASSAHRLDHALYACRAELYLTIVKRYVG